MNASETEAIGKLKHGDEFPYDASDRWWASSSGKKPPKSKDWAHRAARGVIADLSDRRDIKRGFEEVDEGVRKGIVACLAAIIRNAAQAQS